MFTVNTSKDVPDSTYFNRGDCEPTIEKDGTITMYDGYGTRRSSWGSPQVSSTIVHQSEDLLAIHVGFSHKHGGGQFYRYYRPGPTEVRWVSLNDDDRQLVLDGYQEKAPRWAKIPGKLKKNYQKPNPKANLFIGYKVVDVLPDGRMVSLYDGETEYVIGKTMTQKAEHDHKGGYYSYPLDVNPAIMLEAKYVSGNLVPGSPTGGDKAVLKCECWGYTIAYGASWGGNARTLAADVTQADKVASTHLKPVEVIHRFTY